MQRKGIILAGGSGTRLWPNTVGVSKHLLPIFDKPMIYYPLSVLMLAGIRQVAIITTPEDQAQFKRLLGDGGQWGLALTYIVQPSPDGLAQAYLLAEKFLNGLPSTLVLGDNIFYGHGLPEMLERASLATTGVQSLDITLVILSVMGLWDSILTGVQTSLLKKPTDAPSNYAVTGLYFLDERACEMAKQVIPSSRGELEITSLLEIYLEEGSLNVETMGRGIAWLDTGTHASMLDASNFVRTLTERQGMQVGSPDEIAFRNGWITKAALRERAELYSKNDYGRFLARLVDS